MRLRFVVHVMVGLMIGCVLVDLGCSLVQVSHQNAVSSLRPEASSRLNAGYFTCYFIGGARGSLLGTQLFEYSGWKAIVVAGILIGTLALLVWVLAERRRKLQPPRPSAAAS
ncbi:hypothetical protein PS623_04072 [Pseudomonas fluorescens]|nr:hypothetical protein PS623_04072 [Pseudomonas fluorescens]